MGRSFKVQLAWILVVAAMLPLAACGADTGDSDAGAEQPTTGTKAPATGGDEAGTLEGVAALTEMTESGVSGEATLRWNPDTGVLDVTVELMGVAEGAMYAGMIAPGCGPGSGHIHTLGNTVGEPDGTLTLSAEISGVDGIDVDGGWAVKVARPPAGPQACGLVTPR